ncbi:hypothetical protein ABZS66_52985 [Dactylosporangium sp. NPDC005572]|uniref:hypothetical protein n=1 Tax=Dactylosporangium sp. NPDC005572 TaxID=3156889 RepID=UPI0033A40C6F
MNRRVPLIAAAAVLLAGLVGLAVALARADPGGAADPQAAVAGYVEALAAGDRGRLERLADPEHDAAAEITDRLQRLGAGRLVVTGVSIGSTESAAVRPADLTGLLDGAPFIDRIWLYRHDGRWFVALGPHRYAHPKGT